MRNRNVAAFRKAFPPKAETSERLAKRLQQETGRADRSIEAHFTELEADVKAAKAAADAHEEYAKKMAQKRRLEERRGKRL